MKLRIRQKEKKANNQSNSSIENKSSDPKQSNDFNINIDTNLDENIKTMKQMLVEPSDLIVREVHSTKSNQKCAIVYISGLIDQDLVNNNILKTIQSQINKLDGNKLDIIYQEVISITDIKKAKTLDEVSYAVLSGSTAFYLDGSETVLLMGASGGEKRSIEDPPSEPLIRGPRAGFIEDINTNVSLIRKIVKDPNLRLKTYEIGRRSKQKLVVVYMAGITNEKMVKEVNRRLASIDTDYAMSAGHVEQWIEDSFLSPFPQLLNTERPDRVTNAIMKGKVVILIEGTPFALIAPATFADSLRSLEDYSQRWLTGSLLRMLRYLSAFIAMFAPALYIALVSFHPDMLPTKLVFSIQASREGVPFPAVVEAFIMGITFEILHEAGVRLPKIIGSTIGIVGGLVIGESAVSAGIVSPIMVIVTALTAIASFTTPQYSVAIAFRNLRFIFMIAASILGLYGIVLVYIMVNIHMANLKSFGVPYTAPFAPTYINDIKDVVFRAPIMMLRNRPSYLVSRDKVKKSGNKGGQSK